ncbi:hypothetical protein FE697_006695 [Mumia zhuanghuii]|uniref:Phage major capsid protein, HK97 family n=2 Tax=Mumia TaxID=1546255 RepID=A0ABW1QKF9_9ACTN|nr:MULTISPECIES: hypothetical protein [Mumia]KAA1423304.1 hypothetical protein FE697_006695 [Mumia zhuanghuii]
MIEPRRTRHLPPATAERVDPSAIDGLLTEVRNLGRSVTLPGIVGRERLARAGAVSDAAADVRTAVAWSEPYGPGSHQSRVGDLIRDASKRTTNDDREAARERLALDRQLTVLRRDVAWVDATGVMPYRQHAPAVASTTSPLLDRLATPVPAPMGTRGEHMPRGWDNIPDAIIDPPPGELDENGRARIDGRDVGWVPVLYGLDVSLMVDDFTEPGARIMEILLTTIVNTGLERELLRRLTTGLTPGTADEAEASIGTAWPTGADVLVVNPADMPKLRAAYSPLAVPFEVIRTAGAPAGTGVLLASTAVTVLASDMEWMTAVRPAEFGTDIAALRYGLSASLVTGAVSTIDLTGGTP